MDEMRIWTGWMSKIISDILVKGFSGVGDETEGTVTER